MNTRHEQPDPTEEEGLASIERPADDPQTRPALDPDEGLGERETPDDA